MAVDTQRTAELQVLLEGVALPASRQELLDYAGQQPGGQEFLADLRTLPDREYARLDEVGEELFPVQPSSSAEPPPAKRSYACTIASVASPRAVGTCSTRGRSVPVSERT